MRLKGALGRKPASQMQDACKSYQERQFCGLFSFAPAALVHVW
jgi:hypothetical protein